MRRTLVSEVVQSGSIFTPIPARIVSTEQLTEHEKRFVIALPEGLALHHSPGQFLMVSVFGVGEAPISISSSPSRSNGSFELCIRRVGDLTSAIHQLERGDIIGVRGPFGRGFPVERLRGKDLIFVAGGLGLAPLRSLIDEVLDERGNYGLLTVLYGTRSPDNILFKKELADWEKRRDMTLSITVDQPDESWFGEVGFVTSLFDDLYPNPRNAVAVVVGPPVMYSGVIKRLRSLNIPEGNIWLSFERRMKCGVGKCGHCQLNHIYTCRMGPSFAYSEVKDLEEAF
ncbi:MAG: oxidoreductase [Chloroflexi bacterium]|nr:oxidoreductase [Chloroflexota bacterium]